MPPETRTPGKTSRRVPTDAAATPADIAAAIEALTPAQWARLRRYADYRILKLGPKADSRTRDDLLQSALADLLEDKRRWPKEKVDFVRFLAEGMRSISSNWARTYDPEEVPVLETDLLRENDEGELSSPLDNARAKGTDVERRLHDAQSLEQIGRLFADDEEAQKILMAFDDGYDPAGARELWNLSHKQYNTIMRRIRRTLAKAGLTADRNERGF